MGGFVERVGVFEVRGVEVKWWSVDELRQREQELVEEIADWVPLHELEDELASVRFLLRDADENLRSHDLPESFKRERWVWSASKGRRERWVETVRPDCTRCGCSAKRASEVRCEVKP